MLIILTVHYSILIVQLNISFFFLNVHTGYRDRGVYSKFSFLFLIYRTPIIFFVNKTFECVCIYVCSYFSMTSSINDIKHLCLIPAMMQMATILRLCSYMYNIYVRSMKSADKVTKKNNTTLMKKCAFKLSCNFIKFLAKSVFKIFLLVII